MIHWCVVHSNVYLIILPDENSPYINYGLNETVNDPGDSDDDDYHTNVREMIPDAALWKMFHTGVSFRNLSLILNVAFKVAGANHRFYTSRAFLHNKYQRLLRTKENDYTSNLRKNNSLGSICFDHQKMCQLGGKHLGTVDRLAVVWHSKGKDHNLGISEMPDKKGESQALVIERNCSEFAIEKNQIVALVCDNASTNTGSERGTCTNLEDIFDKPLLRLMCRHHILEIVIKDVYHHLFSSDTPNNIFHPILKEFWSELHERNFPFSPLNEPEFTNNMNGDTQNLFAYLKAKAIDELNFQLKSKFIRDDYKEVTSVALKFLRGRVEPVRRNQVEFHALIDSSNARFMATCIQGLESYLFRETIDWRKPGCQRIRENLERFCVFVSLIYIRYWNRSSILFDAPPNDLKFLQDIQRYRSIDESVADIATAALNRHLYYMSEELVPLSLFSEKLQIAEKNEIREKLINFESETMPPRLMSPNQLNNHIAYTSGMNQPKYDWSLLSIVDLIGERSVFFFDVLGINRGFLRVDASEWGKQKEYNAVKRVIHAALICINDGSERVISKCKSKYKKQRCRKECTFRQNIILPPPV